MAKRKKSNMKDMSETMSFVEKAIEVADPAQVDLQDQIDDEVATNAASDAPRLKKNKNGDEISINIPGSNDVISNDYLANIYALNPQGCDDLVVSLINSGVLKQDDFI